MSSVRIGVIGVGGMGTQHARSILGLRDATLAGICDVDGARAERVGRELGARVFRDSDELLESDAVDAVLIATPHFAHTTLGIQAFERGRHVLVEKPISVHKADCERLIAAWQRADCRVFAAMFMTRTEPAYRRIHALVNDGELGQLTRVNWICTDWFRSQAYYDSGTWRATWRGEGGGTLLNQAPHNLDLLQWICGMPSRVMGFCRIARWHDIEVEDDVTAYLEYANGASGVFIVNTGEAPGTNRLELCGERGRLVYEHGRLLFTRNEVETTEFSRTTREAFAKPAATEIEIPISGQAGLHPEIIQNFVDAILHGSPLIAPGAEGIHSVELANAMLYSSMLGRPVDLPLDGAAYVGLLAKLIEDGASDKPARADVAVDLAQSFQKQ